MSCCSSFLGRSFGRRAARGEVVPHRRRGQPLGTCLTQGPGEGSPPHREVVTLGRGVQVRPSSGCGGRRIGHHGRVAVGVRACGHPQQLVLGGSLPASDAGPDRPREGDAVRARRRPTVGRHRGSTLPVTAAVPEPGAARYGRVMWFEDRFSGPDLDREVWFPHYLPAWSSRAATAASYRVDAEGLTLDVPVDHPTWCPETHPTPLRVSGVQSGSWSGPLGSTLGQQHFTDGLTVLEEQERFEGWLPTGGRVEISARMALSHRSMAALWLGGFEDDDEQLRCGELCVFEVFGKDLGPAERPLRRGRRRHQGVPRPGAHPGLRRSPAADRRARAAPVRRRVGRRAGRSSAWTASSSGAARRADLSAPADDRGVRLPGLVDRRRRPPGAAAGRRPGRG